MVVRDFPSFLALLPRNLEKPRKDGNSRKSEEPRRGRFYPFHGGTFCHRTWSPGHRTLGGRSWSNLGPLWLKESGIAWVQPAASAPGFVACLKIQPASVLLPGPGHGLDARPSRAGGGAYSSHAPARRPYRPECRSRGASGDISPLEALLRLNFKARDAIRK